MPTSVPSSRPISRSSTGLEQIARKFADQGSKFSSDRLREDFQAAVAAAAVAFPDSPELTLRSTIWDRLDTIGSHDLEVARKGAKAELSPDQRTQAVELLRRRSRMQGLMATAALGRGWFDDAAFKDQGSFEQTLQRILAASEEDEQSPKAWWREIAAAGERIGLRWQRLAAEIDSLAGEDEQPRRQSGLPGQAQEGRPAGSPARRRRPRRARIEGRGDLFAPPFPRPRPPALDGRADLEGSLVR